MPDLAVASSKRMPLPAPDWGACAREEDDSRIRMNSGSFTLVSSRRVLRVGARHVRRSGGFQENRRHRIFGCGFRSSVAADAAALLSAPHPEKSSFPLERFAATVEEFNLQWPFAGNLHEKGPVMLDGGAAQQLRGPCLITRIYANGMDRSRREGVLRGVGVEAKQIRVRPVVQAGGVPVRGGTRCDQNGLDEIGFGLAQQRLQFPPATIPAHNPEGRVRIG